MKLKQVAAIHNCDSEVVHQRVMHLFIM